MAVDLQNGHVFVADQGNRRVVEFTAWGEFVKAWGWDVVASGPGDDTSPPEDQFEICAPLDGDVCKAGSSGAGGGPGQFGNASQGVAVDDSGAIYVVDLPNQRVQKFDPSGHFVLTFGGAVNKTKVEEGALEEAQNRCTAASGDVCQAGVKGAGSGQFNWEIAPGSFIAVDRGSASSTADDTVYVGDQNRIQLFDAEGHYLEDLPDPDNAVAGKVVQSLATDPQSGNLYLAFRNKEDVLQLKPDGNEVCTLEVERPNAIAADPTGKVWVFSAEKPNEFKARFVQFDSGSCDEESSFDANEEGFKSSTGMATNICAGGKLPGNLFITNGVSGSSFISAYGTPPKTCEDPPPRSPQITDQYAVSAGTDSALVRAKINPHFMEETTFYVEYGTGDCAAGGCESRAPLVTAVPPDISLGGEVTQDPVTTSGVLLTGLAPQTTYHYRFVAESEGGGPEFGKRPAGKEGEEGSATSVAGLEATLTTPPPTAEPDDLCPNQVFRIGASAFLPDCRAYEMVSPVDKNGGGVETAFTLGTGAPHAAHDQSATDGDGITYSTMQAFGDAIGSPYSSQYISSRDQLTGWSTHSVNAPHEGFPGGANNVSLDEEFKHFSEDLSEAWLVHEANPPLAPCGPPDSSALYQRDNATDSYEALHCEPNILFANGGSSIELQGVSADGCQAVFRSRGKLTADAEAGGALDSTPQLYESNCEGPEHSEGPLRLVGKLPNGANCQKESMAGAPSSAEDDGRSAPVWNALSEDAHRLYWTCGETLYLRSDPDLSVEGEPGEKTVEVAKPFCDSGGCLAPRFQSASPDGSRALVTVPLSESKEFKGFGLQAYDAVAGKLIAPPIAAGLEGAEGQDRRAVNLLGASEDATRAWFVSTKVLTETPNSEGDKAAEGESNLYLHREGVGFSFVGTLSADDLRSEDQRFLSPVHSQSLRRASRVSPDGLHAAFVSTAPLTGFDNTDAESDEADAEVFVYDATANGGAGKILCASCNPTGVRPSGRFLEPMVLVNLWAAAWIPGWQSQLYQGHPLSEDGRRLFFNSFEALVNRDTNNRQDVYEWEQVDGVGEAGEEECDEMGAELYVEESSGCLSLISSGQDPEDSEFIDADLDGSDVFIRTNQSLLPQDPGLVDVYDARMGGGFPPPPAPQPPCEGEGCQSPPAPPSFGSPATSGTGPVNPEPTKPCPKGKHKVRQGGKTRCVPRKKGKGKARRGADARRGRAGR